MPIFVATKIILPEKYFSADKILMQISQQVVKNAARTQEFAQNLFFKQTFREKIWNIA